MTRKRKMAECCMPNCSKPSRIAGRCYTHRFELKHTAPEEYARIIALSGEAAEREFYYTKYPLPPKWQYPGKEHELIAVLENENGQ
jgi:hypothetical protein